MKVLVDMSDESDRSKTWIPRETNDSNSYSKKKKKNYYNTRKYIAKMVV